MSPSLKEAISINQQKPANNENTEKGTCSLPWYHCCESYPGALTKAGVDKDTKGVVIIEIDPNSQVAQEGSISLISFLKSIETVSSLDFKSLTKNLKTGESIIFLLQRQGNTFFKAFKIR